MFSDVKAGDVVHRLLSGTVPMDLKVTEIDADLIHCGPWTFDRKTGAEVDHDLRWGPQYGITDSFLTEQYTEEQQTKLEKIKAIQD